MKAIRQRLAFYLAEIGAGFMPLRQRLSFFLTDIATGILRLAYWVGGVDHDQKFSAELFTINGQRKGN
jgi:hypothetical protein